MDFSNKEDIKNSIHSYLSNQESEKDIENLLMWLDESDENKKEFIDIRRTWILSSQAPLRGRFNKEKYDEWQKVSATLSPRDKDVPKTTISGLQMLIRLAAVFLLLVAIGATIAWSISARKLNTLISVETVHKINVPFGGRGEVFLPDGSKVKLNAGSSLSYSGCYGHNGRVVVLEGEGYFEVETNPGIPFVVKASGLEIKAYGTIFNVKAYPEEKEVTTTLVEGIVKIKGDYIDHTLAPNEKLTYILGQPGPEPLTDIAPEVAAEKSESDIMSVIEERNNVTIEPPKIMLASNVRTRDLTAWKDGIFIFNAEKLSSLAVYLERRYDVSIIIDSDELMDHKFTGTFHQETLEQILGIIKLSSPIKYNIEKGVVTIEIDRRRSAIFRELS